MLTKSEKKKLKLMLMEWDWEDMVLDPDNKRNEEK